MSMPRMILGAVLLGLLASASSAARGPVERLSLEQLLAQQRAQVTAHREAARADVDETLAIMHRLGDEENPDQRLQELRDRLIAHGGAITPLLLPALRGPQEPNDLDRKLAGEVALALSQMPLAPILDDLVHLAQSGSKLGRQSAVRVLGSSQQPNRIGPLLARIFHENEPLRPTTIRALAALGGSAADEVLALILSQANTLGQQQSASQFLLGDALVSLADALNKKATLAPGSLAFLRTVCHSQAASYLLPQLLAMLKAMPAGVLSKADTAQLIAIASERMAPTQGRLELLDALPSLSLPFDRDLLRKLELITQDSEPSLVEAALVCLARLGHQPSRKQLLKPYNSEVANDRNDAAAYEARGHVLSQIGQYAGAINDFKKSIKLNQDRRRRSTILHPATIGLARALCLKGDLKAAHRVLKDSVLSAIQLGELAKDPDFAALAADPRYSKILHP